VPRNLRGRFRLGLPAALATASLLLGALPVNASRPAATSVSTLTIGTTSDALTLDPTLTTDEASLPVENPLFNSLVKSKR
jgi:ABC-type transport system substrate-binding protein